MESLEPEKELACLRGHFQTTFMTFWGEGVLDVSIDHKFRQLKKGHDTLTSHAGKLIYTRGTLNKSSLSESN